MQRIMVVTVVVLLACTPAAARPAGSGWEGLYGGPAGTATATAAGPAAPALRWAVTVGGSRTDGRYRTAGLGDPVVLDTAGRLLVRADDATAGGRPTLYALRGDDGSVAFTVPGAYEGCAPGVAPDGRTWVQVGGHEDADRYGVAEQDGRPVRALHAVDATGAAAATFTRPGGAPGAPRLLPCTSGLRFLSDSTIVTLERSQDADDPGSLFLRAVATHPVPAQRWVRAVDTDADASPGWVDDLRVGPAGAPNADTIYTFRRQSPTALVVEARSPADGQVRGTVPVAGHTFRPHAVALAPDGRLFLATAGGPGGVAGYLVALHDDGVGAPTILWQQEIRPGTTELQAALGSLALGDGGTLLATYAGPHRGLVGVDVRNGARRWEQSFGSIDTSLAADVTGTGYVVDPSAAGVVAVGVAGTPRWALSLDDLPPGTWQVAAAGANGDVYLTGAAPGAPLQLAAVRTGRAVVRRAGPTRIDTAVAVSRAAHPVDGAVTWAVLARSDDYPDALAGGPLAHRLGGPLLLTSPAGLASQTEAELRRLGVRRVVLLGGQAALSDQVRVDLLNAGLQLRFVERIEGRNRFHTAALVAERVGGTRAVVVEGANADPGRGWPDAVAASGFSALTGRPILLVERDRVPEDTEAVIGRLGIDRAIVVGGRAAVADATAARIATLTGRPVERLAGATRYATSVAVAERALAEGARLGSLWVATGTAFADALAAGPAAAAAGGLLLLVDGRDPDGAAEALDFLAARAGGVGQVSLAGGPGAISAAVEDHIRGGLGR
jgi:hypothetical protein